jgi:hypothetical protein
VGRASRTLALGFGLALVALGGGALAAGALEAAGTAATAVASAGADVWVGLTTGGLAGACAMGGCAIGVGVANAIESAVTGGGTPSGVAARAGAGVADDLVGGAMPRFGPGAASTTEFGGSAASAGQLLREASRVGSALKRDPLHLAPSFVVDDVAANASVFPMAGPAGSRVLVQMAGEANETPGVFEWIINPSNRTVVHESFNPGAPVNGVPLWKP